VRRRAPALLAAPLIVGAAATASAHEVDTDRLWLRPDLARSELKGQITFNPHYTREDPAPGSPAPPPTAAADVVALLERALTLAIDGRPCRTRYEVRELWSPGAPSPGDVVTLRCPLPASATRFSVRAELPVDPLIVAVEVEGAEAQPLLLRAGTSSPEYSLGRAKPPPPSAGAQAWRYFVLGIEHIVPRGLDHVSFVVSLVLGERSDYRRLLIRLTAFTLAHTLTLALAAAGVFRVPAGVVEPLIALSIAVVALDNLRTGERTHARSSVVFGFGLLHGLGFAGALSEIGITRGAFLVSLLSFNLGVEISQLLVVAVALVVLAWLRRRKGLDDLAVRVGSLAIAAVALWWTAERVLG
jgi:hypothetical protein